MSKYSKGDYTNCRYDICEILRDDEVYCIVGTEYADKIINELNTLNDENEDLKNNIGEQGVRLDFAICETQDFKNKWLKLKKENEQLKKERNHFEKKKTQYLTEWNTCRIENTELKNLIQEAYQTERTELGRSVLKQLLERIQ